MNRFPNIHRFTQTLGLCSVALALTQIVPLGAQAATLPSQPGLQFQTSGRERAPGIGDWYTTTTSASTDRIHRYVIDVTQEMLDSNGGSVSIIVHDAESFGNLDEPNGPSDPTRFELRAANGVTVLQSQTVPSGTVDNVTVTFNVTVAGSYQVTSVTGGFPISGDSTVGFNDDDNTFTLEVPSGVTSLIGQYQGTLQHNLGGTQNYTFYFMVGPGQSTLQLRNFDYDTTASNNKISYERPDGSTVAGTASGNGVWNNGGTLNTGADTISGLQTVTGGAPDAGVWQIHLNNFTNTNQLALEVNSGSRIVILDQPPTTSGNFLITPDTTLSTTIGTPVDHAFSVSNYFFTNDIVNFTTSNTAANYTVQILDNLGNPLTDTDGDGYLDTGILTPNQTRNFILRVTPNVGAGPTDATRVNGVSFMDSKTGAPTTRYVTKTTNLPGNQGVSGTVYEDLDRNGTFGGPETGTGLTGLFVKAIPTAGGDAVAAAPVNAGNGGYTFTGLTPGEYTLILDDNSTLTDTTAYIPPNYVVTESPGATRTATVIAGQNVPNQNFGLYLGSRLTGVVFQDDGAGGGIPNNGIRDGGEVGLGGVAVRMTNSAGTVTIQQTLTDSTGAYAFYLSNAQAGVPLRIAETNGGNYISTGGTPGDTGGSYSRATDATAFTPAVGVSYANVNFGDVPVNTLTNDGMQTAPPGGSVLYPHVFTAGSGGSVTFTQSQNSNPNNPLWTSVVYLDANADGILQPGEVPVSGPVVVTSGQNVALLVKQYVPFNALLGAQNIATLTANFTYTNASPSLSATLTRNDTTLVGTANAANGLQLLKSVDKATAEPGEVVTYTIQYRNSTMENLANLVINDATPAYTEFVSASNGALPANLTTVSTLTPPVNGTGALSWTFTGTLAPNAFGTVVFQVRIR